MLEQERKKEEEKWRAERSKKLMEKSMRFQSMPFFRPGQLVEIKDTGEKFEVMPEARHPYYWVKSEKGRVMLTCSLDCRPFEHTSLCD